MGCHATEHTSASCPLRILKSFIIRRSTIRHDLSLDADARKFPEPGWNRTIDTVCLWKCRVDRHRLERGSQSLRRLSFEPEAMRPLVGCQSTVRTSQPCPLSIRSSMPSLKFHILIKLSSPPLTNLVSLGENLMLVSQAGESTLCLLRKNLYGRRELWRCSYLVANILWFLLYRQIITSLHYMTILNTAQHHRGLEGLFQSWTSFHSIVWTLRCLNQSRDVVHLVSTDLRYCSLLLVPLLHSQDAWFCSLKCERTWSSSRKQGYPCMP